MVGLWVMQKILLFFSFVFVHLPYAHILLSIFKKIFMKIHESISLLITKALESNLIWPVFSIWPQNRFRAAFSDRTTTVGLGSSLPKLLLILCNYLSSSGTWNNFQLRTYQYFYPISEQTCLLFAYPLLSRAFYLLG